MRALRLCLAGTIMMALLGGLGGAVLAQAEEASTSGALTEFTGRMECYDLSMGTIEDVVIATTEAGDLIRREWRGSTLSVAVREISDPRLDGRIAVSFSSDEYLIASDEPAWQLSGVDPDVWPRGVVASTYRLTNDDGSWHGSRYQNWYPDGDSSTTTAVYTGEGAYEGLIAVMEMDFDELNPVCAWDVHGYVIEGELPPTPELPAE
jgi:hypothetical protein